MKKLPSELKQDKKGFYYVDNQNINEPIYFSDYQDRDEFTCKSCFYRIPSTNDYIAKSNVILQNRFERKQTLKMLKAFLKVKDKLKNVDLPIAYFKEGRHLNGTIIPYYECASSIKNMLNNFSLNNYQIIYNHNDDKLENLVSLFMDIINLIESMYVNGIYYYDVNYGNFLIYKNEVKVIDFEPKRVRFMEDKYTFSYILTNYLQLVREILEKYRLPIYQLYDLPNYKETKHFASDEVVKAYANKIGYDFDDVKKYIKTLESNIKEKH